MIIIYRLPFLCSRIMARRTTNTSNTPRRWWRRATTPLPFLLSFLTSSLYCVSEWSGFIRLLLFQEIARQWCLVGPLGFNIEIPMKPCWPVILDGVLRVVGFHLDQTGPQLKQRDDSLQKFSVDCKWKAVRRGLQIKDLKTRSSLSLYMIPRAQNRCM